MPLVDPRTDRLVAVWGIRIGEGILDAIYTKSATERESFRAGQQLGRLFFIHSGVDQPEALLRVGFDSITALNIGGLGEETFGFTYPSSGAGLGPWKLNLPGRQDRVLGNGYPGPQTNGLIHSAERVVTVGTNVLSFNLAAGGYLHSWTVGGAEILNRGNTYGRGLQNQLEFADVSNGRLILHRPSQAGNLFNSGFGAIGSTLLSIAEEDNRITIETIPLELDPGGAQGVPGVSTDHGGDDTHPVQWTGTRCAVTITIDAVGVSGLHRIDTRWETPFAVQSAFLDCAAYTALCLNGTFDQVVVFDRGLGSGTDVSAAVDAVDFRRFSVSDVGTYQDDVASPSSASTLTSAFGGVYGRNTSSDLTVFLVGRLHTIDQASLDLSLADVPRGTQATYMTNRTGGTGLDGSQAVILGLDSNLTSRWYNLDQARRIPNGRVTYTRWLSIGPLATALANALQIPDPY